MTSESKQVKRFQQLGGILYLFFNEVRTNFRFKKKLMPVFGAAEYVIGDEMML